MVQSGCWWYTYADEIQRLTNIYSAPVLALLLLIKFYLVLLVHNM